MAGLGMIIETRPDVFNLKIQNKNIQEAESSMPRTQILVLNAILKNRNQSSLGEMVIGLGQSYTR